MEMLVLLLLACSRPVTVVTSLPGKPGPLLPVLTAASRACLVGIRVEGPL